MKINKPDEAEIRAEHYLLYKGNSQKAVASASGVSSTTLSRRLDQNETIVKNPIYEVIMEMIGSVESDQASIGKGIFRMIYNHAVELGLVNEQPLDIIQLAIEQLQNITPEQLRMMPPEQRFAVQGFSAELEEEAGRVKTDAIAARHTGQTHAREFSRVRASSGD